MKKALFISSRPIYPIIGGGEIRTEQQLEFLSREYEVEVIFLSAKKDNDIQSCLKFAKGVKVFYRSKLMSVIGTLRFIFNHLPLQVNYYLDGKMKNYILSVGNRYDVIFCNNIRTAEYALPIIGPTKIIDFVDAISMNYEKAIRHSSGLKKLIYMIDYLRCRNYEQFIKNTFDRCSIISEVDKNFIEQCPK